MIIKDFKKGQLVFVVYMYKGGTEEAKIYERYVEKVGRKYVYDDRGHKYIESHIIENGLYEDCETGEHGYLFNSEIKAKEFIEKNKLNTWLTCLRAYGNKYSLEQLRKVKKILES